MRCTHCVIQEPLCYLCSFDLFSYIVYTLSNSGQGINRRSITDLGCFARNTVGELNGRQPNSWTVKSLNLHFLRHTRQIPLGSNATQMSLSWCTTIASFSRTHAPPVGRVAVRTGDETDRRNWSLQRNRSTRGVARPQRSIDC